MLFFAALLNLLTPPFLGLVNHHHSYKLGFKTFISHSSFAARPGNSRIGPLVSLRVSLMGGSKRLFSTSSEPGSSILEDKKNKRLKGLKGTTSNSVEVVAVEKIHSVDIQSIKDDPAKIEAMTVAQLRTILRNLGVTAKGRKCDLVSSLKHFMDKNSAGGNSLEAEDHICSDFTENVYLQKKAKSILDESCASTINTVSDVSGLKHSKSRVKHSLTEEQTVKIECEIVAAEKELSVTIDGGSVSKSSSARKISSNICSEDVKGRSLVSLPQAEPWTVLAHKKPQKEWIPYNPRTMRPPPLTGDTKSMKLMSWNVNGLRALLKLEEFSVFELAQRENFDVLCLQETKLQEKDVDSIKQRLIDGYENSFWTCSHSKLGYSGTAMVSRIKPLSVRYGLGIPDHDSEGRLVTAEFDSFYLISGYVPNSGDGLKRLSYRITQWDPSLSNYMKELEKSKPVILTGDLNCAYQEIDIYNPAGNRRSAGFTDEERQSFATNFLTRGFVDTFRKQHPNVVGYTYWGYRYGARKTNKGWRLDYFLVSESIASKVYDSYIVPNVSGSDHCPIGIILKH